MDPKLIPKVLYSLYIGELLAHPATYFTKKVGYPTHFHSGCHCEACDLWNPLTEDRYANITGFQLCIGFKTPMSMDTVILENVSEVVTVVKTIPWQSCECEHCNTLYGAAVHYLKLEDGTLRLKDLDHIRKHFISIAQPSILPLAHPSGKQTKMYEFADGNAMEVQAHKHGGTLYININTSSEDGFKIDRDPGHLKFEGWATRQ